MLLGVGLAAASVALGQVEGGRIAALWSLVGVAVLALLRRDFMRWLPERRYQVAGGRLARDGATSAAFIWGVELGLGVRTYLITPVFYAVVGFAIYAGPWVAFICGATYGLVRGTTIALAAASARRRGEDRPALLGIEQASRRPLAVALVFALALVMTSIW